MYIYIDIDEYAIYIWCALHVPGPPPPPTPMVWSPPNPAVLAATVLVLRSTIPT